MPEYIVTMVATAMLGWGTFTWRRSETAVEAAMKASDAVDKLELKLAEKYLTKEDFEAQMERLFKTLARLEEKLDYHVYNQGQDILALRQRFQKHEG